MQTNITVVRSRKIVVMKQRGRRLTSSPASFFLCFLVVAAVALVDRVLCLSSSSIRNHQQEFTRRDALRSTAAALVTSASSVGVLLTNDKNWQRANAVETTTSLDVTGTGAYLMPEYYNDPVTAASKGRFFFPTLTPPFQNRATYRYDLGRDAWTFEQLLTFTNVTATIKTNVIRLKSGGLWVHSPQWPTGEFCHLLDELGTVEHVVLPCNAFEHAAPVKAFCKKYPQASVWISPGQYGPFGSCGMSLKEPFKLGYKVDGIFGMDSNSNSNDSDNDKSRPPWADEFDYSTLYVSLPENAGPVSEVAFVHKPTKTLIATDGVVFIPEKPSAIFSTYFDEATLSQPNFWPKSVLQSVFLPLRVDESTGTNVYPGYEAIQGRLLRAPILRGFNDSRSPVQTRKWINDISKWQFDRIITSHFASPIAATPTDLKATFAFLNNEPGSAGNQNSEESALPPIACKDWELLDGLNDFIATNKIGAPATFDYKSDCK